MLPDKKIVCPDCDGDGVGRREFLRLAAAATATAAGGLLLPGSAAAAPSPKSAAETAVKTLYDTLSDKQKKTICFDWDHQDAKRGPLRTHVSNNWHITKPTVASDFYTREQQVRAGDVFKSIFSPEWHQRLFKQLKDDTNGHPWGTDQNIALFGKPGAGKFEFVMTGRHLTCRADGNSSARCLGWPDLPRPCRQRLQREGASSRQRLLAPGPAGQQGLHHSRGKQQKEALVARRPAEKAVAFRGARAAGPAFR